MDSGVVTQRVNDMLKGVKVIDAASYVAGPAAATVMGDHGASVIKIEPPSGDAYRGLAGRYRTDYNWQLTSRNKRSIALDLRSEQGQEILLSLVDSADVLLVNFNAEQLKKYRLEYEYLKTRNPSLIFAQVTAYGNRGPEAGRRGFDVAAWWARSGIMDMMKPLGGPPINGVGGVGDHASAMSLFGAIMMALYRREKTGQGSHVSTSLAANGVWCNGMHIQGAIAGFDLAAILEEKGYRSPFFVPYKTRDKRYIILVGPAPKREWPRLCQALSREEWLSDPRFTDMRSVMHRRDEVREMLAKEFARHNLTALVRTLDKADVTYSVVEKVQDVLRDAHLIENEVLIRTESDDPDYQWTVNSPIEVAGVSKQLKSEAPTVGQHTRQILMEAGFDEAEIDKLLASGVVKQ